MTEPMRLLVGIGTRPEAIKLAPVILAARAAGDVETRIALTGQHGVLASEVLETFGIAADVDFALMAPGQTLGHILRKSFEGFERAIADFRPDAIVVQGDTTTAFAGALAGFQAQIPVVHVEAGLRTGDLQSPFPEEGNRQMISVLAALHLCPTSVAAANLTRQGIDAERVVVTGNTVIDALHHVLSLGARVPSRVAQFIDQSPTVLVTAHRRESWGLGLASIATGLARAAQSHPDWRFVFPMHPNPVVRDQVSDSLEGLTNVLLLDALPYREFSALLARSDIVVTDSGGIQEEAPSLGKPVLVTRDVTERPEAVAAGAAVLVGVDSERINEVLSRLMSDSDTRTRMQQAGSPYGDGHAAERTIVAIRHLLRGGPRAAEFKAESETHQSPAAAGSLDGGTRE